MTVYTTNELKNSMKVMLDNDPYVILENNYVKPGKGQAFNRIKLRNLKNNRVIERTLKSGDTLQAADVFDIEVHYLYNDSHIWHFMDPVTFEQYAADRQVVNQAKLWLKEQDLCILTLFNGSPLCVTPPNFVNLKIVETDPGLRGDTSGGGGKPARLETGAIVRVPLFVQTGELIKVDTRTGEYLSRIKE
ncbi:elongation factor P [Rickettsiella grylli]|nr:elongation factor P [Rickettsiella grylli]OIZ99077.1 elongation factor P [Rickettsiella grylli]